MAQTMAQVLADKIRYQASAGDKVLEAAGDNSGAVFGNPADVLSVRGNISDIAVTNHLWLLDAAASGAVGNIGALAATRPTDIPGAVAFLAPRDTDSAEQASARLKQVNEGIARAIEGLSDADLDKTVDVTFYGPKSLRDLCFIILDHGSLHIGQAWGILKGKGLA